MAASLNSDLIFTLYQFNCGQCQSLLDFDLPEQQAKSFRSGSLILARCFQCNSWNRLQIFLDQNTPLAPALVPGLNGQTIMVFMSFGMPKESPLAMNNKSPNNKSTSRSNQDTPESKKQPKKKRRIYNTSPTSYSDTPPEKNSNLSSEKIQTSKQEKPQSGSNQENAIELPSNQINQINQIQNFQNVIPQIQHLENPQNDTTQFVPNNLYRQAIPIRNPTTPNTKNLIADFKNLEPVVYNEQAAESNAHFHPNYTGSFPQPNFTQNIAANKPQILNTNYVYQVDQNTNGANANTFQSYQAQGNIQGNPATNNRNTNVSNMPVASYQPAYDPVRQNEPEQQPQSNVNVAVVNEQPR